MMLEILNVLKKRPVLAVFEVTKYCNEKCTMCGIPIRKPHKEMSINEIEIVFKKLKKIGTKEVFLQGGEPLLRKDIFEIMILLKKLGFSQTLISNGLLLNEDVFSFLSKNDIDLGVSLDTLDSKKYKKIRGTDGLQKLLGNLSLARKFNHKHWSLHCTVSKLNCNEVIKIKKFAENIGFDFFALPYIYGIGMAGTKNDELVYGKEILPIFRKLYLEEKDFLKKIVFKEVINFLEKRDIGRCDALFYSIKINELGQVSPCIEFPPYLDLLKEQQKELLDKNQLELVEKCSKNTPCFYGCTRTFCCMLKNKKELLLHPLKVASSVRKYS